MAEKVVKHEQTFKSQDVIDVEREHLKLNEQKTVSGLAISGGGIRSASFGLGVMQSLVANNQLSKMDYMSTVSGGAI
jgi:predicted patatin/cPLA2 family phospholipase